MNTRPWDAEFIKLLPQLKRYAHTIIYNRATKSQLHVDDYIQEAYITLTATKKEIPLELVKNYALQAVKWTILNRLRTEAKRNKVLTLYDDVLKFYPDSTESAADLVTNYHETPDYENKLYIEQIKNLVPHSKSKYSTEFFNLILQGYSHGDAGEALKLTKIQGRSIGRKLAYFIKKHTLPQKVLKELPKPKEYARPVIAFSINRYKSRKKGVGISKGPKKSISLTITKKEMVLWRGKEYAILKNSGLSYQKVADIYNTSRELVKYSIDKWKKHQRNQKTIDHLSSLVKCH
jgi:DNA-directed RNA polymerase specialized sigma24 family protein